MFTERFLDEFGFTLALKKVFFVSFMVGAYSLIPLFVHDYFSIEQVERLSSGLLETILGLILGLLLVFRANRAYERWWEARTNWGILVNVSRNVAIKVHTFIEPKGESAQYFHLLVSQFSKSMLYHLRDIDCRNMLDKKISIPDHIKHIPLYITQQLYELLEKYRSDGVINDIQYLNIDTDLSRFMHVLGACEKIKTSLISISYREFVHHIMVVLLAILPWRLVHTFELWTGPLVMMIAYITLGLEGIARNLEEPFGTTEDDVHMESISDGITRSTREALIKNLDSPLNTNNNKNQV